AQDGVFNLRVDTRLVTLDVGVLDGNNRPLTTLTKDDFSVYEDDELREIQNFSNVDNPYNVLALFDCTGSTRDSWPFLLQSLNRFLSSVRPQDRVAVAAFGNPTHTILDWTPRSTGTLNVQMQMPSPLCDQTNFYGAVTWAVKKARDMTGRKGVVVFTDGVHSGIPSKKVRIDGLNLSRFVDPAQDGAFMAMLRAVERSDTVFYFIAVNTDIAPGNSDASDLFPGTQYTPLALYNMQQVRSRMEQIVKVSGGRIVFSQRTSDTGLLFEQIVQELGTSYSMGFTPSPATNGSYHRISVRVRGDGMKVRQSKDGYYAR
ncbi:MAG TPA: VWA domain-containing protein, partial [Terriglobia bacterium]|nr:VWA domain-containing protein [Terriglobia bacterium]